MRRRDNMNEDRQMGKMLSEMKRLTLENYILPEDEEDFGGGMEDEEPVGYRDEGGKGEITGIEKELTQIRKIALSVINRLADQPTSPQYDTMKKIWNMVDKAIEQPQKENGGFSNQ